MSRTVAVVGGGYGGTAVAKTLESVGDVVLIDPRDAFVNVAASLRALARPDWAGNMFFPFETVLSRGTVIRDRAVSVDPGGVTLASGERVAADYLVLATGSSYAYPARPSADSMAAALDDLRQTNKELASAERVLILGAGPVGLELAGEIKGVWPEKHVTIVDPAERLLPGFKREMRDDLHRQLDEFGIEVRLSTSLAGPLTTEAGRAATLTATTTDGGEITADIWFRAFGLRINSDYLVDGRLTTLTSQGQVRVTKTLNVRGLDGILGHVYAVGDLTDVAEDKLAAYALQHAEVVAQNITAQLRGERAVATYQPMPDPMILLPLGPQHGVGQMPTPGGPAVIPAATVAEYKGVDLFTGRFTAQFGPTAA
ncbi:FAD-dependent oxidoreductase [Micromonospora sp. NPDC049645]|uniref:NAD(P)/FAD-dependent oxidoreductase n=1 Tax=Micromonospora sp. NPDC049645 TaxID=3155508 RepID=UPI003415D176